MFFPDRIVAGAGLVAFSSAALEKGDLLSKECCIWPSSASCYTAISPAALIAGRTTDYSSTRACRWAGSTAHRPASVCCRGNWSGMDSRLPPWCTRPGRPASGILSTSPSARWLPAWRQSRFREQTLQCRRQKTMLRKIAIMSLPAWMWSLSMLGVWRSTCLLWPSCGSFSSASTKSPTSWSFSLLRGPSNLTSGLGLTLAGRKGFRSEVVEQGIWLPDYH